MRQKQEIHTVFLDIMKAYDSVPHAQLFETLTRHGIPEQFVGMLGSLYEGCRATVITPYKNSPEFRLTRGMKQGCPMSPILFNLFLEPMLEWIIDEAAPDNHVLAFADDIAINAPNSRDIQQTMDRIEKFFHHNRIDLGIARNKTAYMTSHPEANEIEYRKLVEVENDGKIFAWPDVKKNQTT